MSSSTIPTADLESFSLHLRSSTRILALLGAGLSASSGLPTFRGAGGLWRNHDATSLATPEAFEASPDLVWQFYSYRRHMALQAKPNPAHYALAELARRKEGFITLSQNVDGKQDGSANEQDNYEDPIVPALAIPQEGSQPLPSRTDKTGAEATKSLYESMKQANAQGEISRDLDVSDASIPIPQVQPKDLPRCPKCHEGLLRPGVVWFGEMLPNKVVGAVEEFIRESKKIDLMLVIGTSAKVYPAAGYVDRAREKGAKIAVINTDRADTPGGKTGSVNGDWFFEGDAGVIIPEILESVIGSLRGVGPAQSTGND